MTTDQENSPAVATGKIVTVITTVGKKTKVLFEGNQWKSLFDALNKGGSDINGNSFKFDLSNMKCVEGLNRHTLEHESAVLPEGNFNLFLFPIRTKSGAEKKKAVKKAAPKKAAKKAAPKKKAAAPKKAADKVDNGVGGVVNDVAQAKAKEPVKEKTADELRREDEDETKALLEERDNLSYGFKDIDRNKLSRRGY